jgi:asparagine N-glycosylation enzyme membrane subunit Stt3
MKIKWLKLTNLLIVSLLALVFFVFTASFNYFTQDKNYTKWTSPDETANYFFSKRFSETGQLAYFDQAAIIGDNLVMPRSLRSDFGWVKPVSFLGIILTYGSIGAQLGVGVIPFLTPFFAALGIIIFYLLVSRIFENQRVGLVSSFLLASFPVYIYYTVRSMFHNVLFIVFLLIGAYLLLLALGAKQKRNIL